MHFLQRNKRYIHVRCAQAKHTRTCSKKNVFFSFNFFFFKIKNSIHVRQVQQAFSISYTATTDFRQAAGHFLFLFRCDHPISDLYAYLFQENAKHNRFMPFPPLEVCSCYNREKFVLRLNTYAFKYREKKGKECKAAIETELL